MMRDDSYGYEDMGDEGEVAEIPVLTAEIPWATDIESAAAFARDAPATGAGRRSATLACNREAQQVSVHSVHLCRAHAMPMPCP